MNETSRHSKFDLLRHGAEKYLKERGGGKPSEDREQDILAAIDDLELRYAQLQMTLESIADGFFACDADWRLIYVNGAAERMLGISKTEVLGKTHREVFPESLAARLESEYPQAGEVRDFEVFFEPRGCWFRTRCFPRGDGGISVCFEDITERGKTLETLRASEERLRLFIEHAPVGLAMFDREMRYLSFSRAWLSNHNLGDVDLEGRSHYELFPEISEEWKTIHRRALAGEVLRADEDRFVRADGSVKWFRWELRPWRDAAGDVGGIVIFSEDITGSKLIEEDLHESRTKLEAALAGMTDAVSISDAEGRLIDFNDAFVKFYRFRKKDECLKTLVEYTDILDVFTDDRQPAPLDRWVVPRALRGETATNAQYCLRRKDTGETWVGSYSFAPIRDKDGVIVGAVVSARDITELKLAEETLRKSEERFRELAENIREVFWIYSPEEMIYVSPAYEEVWGKSRKSLYRKPSSFLRPVHPEDKVRVRKAYDADLRGTAPFHEEFRILRPDGTLRWIRARSFPVSVQGRIARAVGIAEDITSIKEAEKFLSIERDLAFGIGSSASLAEGMAYLLNACLNFDGLDSGAIYMVDPKSGALNLICHSGVSDSFSKATSFYEAASPQSRFAMKAKPRFWSKPFAIPELNDLFEREGFLAFFAIPVVYEGEVVALLCLASHTAEIPENVQLAFEIMANHIGGIISRVRLVDTVKAQGERLQEANAALRVLLKQRDEDRTELEESLLRNVKHLIAPYLDKLKKSRLAVEQLRFVEIMESHLREITSPFVHKLSAPMLGLTPTEIRVAELIRQGKSSKEIGELLGITENSVIFHRQGIRRKLDLTGKKLNLQTYLGTLL